MRPVGPDREQGLDQDLISDSDILVVGAAGLAVDPPELARPVGQDTEGTAVADGSLPTAFRLP